MIYDLCSRQVFREGPYGVGGFAEATLRPGACIGRLPYSLVLSEAAPWAWEGPASDVPRAPGGSVVLVTGLGSGMVPPVAAGPVLPSPVPEVPVPRAAVPGVPGLMSQPEASFGGRVLPALAAAAACPEAHPPGDPVCMSVLLGSASRSGVRAGALGASTVHEAADAPGPAPPRALTLSVSDSRYLLYTYMVAIRAGHACVDHTAGTTWGPYLASLPTLHHLPMAWEDGELQVWCV